MKYKKSVYRNLMLITQVGISMMAPIFLCVAAGVFIDGKFNTWITITLLILGVAAGFRNTYIMIMNSIKTEEYEKIHKDKKTEEGIKNQKFEKADKGIKNQENEKKSDGGVT
jgi:ATP synthase protein I